VAIPPKKQSPLLKPPTIPHISAAGGRAMAGEGMTGGGNAVDLTPACRECGAPLSEAKRGAYRGLLHCVDFCNQFGPGEHADPVARLRALLHHAETWSVASAMTPQHAESVRETFAGVFKAFDALVSSPGAHAVGGRAAATLPDSKRIDEMETFVRWAAATYPDVIKGVLINGTPDGDISVTVLGPDDCFTARDLRQAIDDATLAITEGA
jgi:hypothetical protein